MKRKNGFFTLCFACGFGAGQMYLGYMRRGLSIMLIAAADFFLMSLFNNTVFGVLLPVIWAYAFFDTFRLRSQETPCPDAFLFDLPALLGSDWRRLVRRRHHLIGWLLVGFCVYALYNNFVAPSLWQVAEQMGLVWLMNFLYGQPTLIVAALMIGLGVWLLRGPHAKDDDDYVGFGGKGDGGNG